MSKRYIPDEVIDAILKRHDIVEVIAKYVHLTKRGKNLIGLCPFHSEKTPSFTVSPEKQIFNCFGCGMGGNAVKFMMEIEGYSYPEAVSHLAEEADIPFQWDGAREGNSVQNREREMLLQAHELSAKWYHYVLKNSEHGKVALNYMQQRGFSERLIEQFQIGYAPPMRDTLAQFLHKKQFDLPLLEKGGLLTAQAESGDYMDRFRDRIMFPICDSKGKVIAFAGRVLKPDIGPKYLNSPETLLFNKSRSLFHLHQARAAIRKTQSVVLFEGYIDVIKAWDAGVENGVATMGTSLTDEHVALLKRYAKHVILCYDGDEAGQMAAIKSLSMLEKRSFIVSVAVIPDQLDPDDYISQHGADSFKREIIEGALSSTSFRLLHLQRDYRLSTDQGQLQYIQAALSIIASIESPTEREHYLKELSQQFDYSFDTLKQEMNESRLQLQKKIRHRDNNGIPWNNVMNESRATAPALLPAYHNAEKHLLSMMMHSRELAEYVAQELGDQFNVKNHAALAQQLYAFYAQHEQPDMSRFIASLQNNELENVASRLYLIDIDHDSKPEVIEEYIRRIRQFPLKQQIERKKQEMKQAERAGELIQAAQIAKDIHTLERQLKA